MDFEFKQEPIETDDGYLLVSGSEEWNIKGESLVRNEASSTKNFTISGEAGHTFLRTDEQIVHDDEMQLLLQQWGLEILSDRFAKNLIDVSVLDYIVDVDIIDLCRDLPIRYRLILRHNLKQKTYPRQPEPDRAVPKTNERKRKKTSSFDMTSFPETSCQERGPIDTPATKSPTPPAQAVQPRPRKYDAIQAQQCFTLREICEQYESGRKFLEQYKIENGKRIYSGESRKYIKNAVVEHYFRLGRGHISGPTFYYMTQVITNELPDENPSIWYDAGDSDSSRQCQKGLLYSRYRYLKASDKRFQKRKETAVPRHSTVVFDQAKQGWEDLSEAQQSVCLAVKSKFLDFGYASSEEMLTAWKEFFPLRRYEAVTGNIRLEEWTALSTFDDIHELINSDFCSIYPTKTGTIRDRVFEYVKRFKSVYQGYRSLTEEDKMFTATLLIALKDGFEPTDKNTFLALYVLPLIVRPNFVIKGKKRRKPSRWECRNAFITLLESEDQVTQTIEENIRVATEYNIEPRPFIIAIGFVTHDISSYLVVLGNEIIKCETIISAVELLFKLYIVFHLEYSNLCEGVLKFIQSYLFELVFDGESQDTAVAALTTDLNRT